MYVRLNNKINNERAAHREALAAVTESLKVAEQQVADLEQQKVDLQQQLRKSTETLESQSNTLAARREEVAVLRKELADANITSDNAEKAKPIFDRIFDEMERRQKRCDQETLKY